MALAKLWNALFGKKSQMPPAPSPQPASSTAGLSEPVAAAERARPRRVKGAQRPASRGRKPVSETPSEPGTLAAVPAATDTASRPAHPRKNRWTRWVQQRPVATILDLNLGDASRAVELVEAIVCASAPVPRYIAIDRFELPGGSMPLRSFHQKLRCAGGQAVAIPGEPIDGLRQLARTIGAVDLILLDVPAELLQQPQFRALLSRVRHANTLVLQPVPGGKWQQAVDQTSGMRQAS